MVSLILLIGLLAISKYSSKKIDIDSILVEITDNLMRLVGFAKEQAKIPGIVDQIYKDAGQFQGAFIDPISELAMEIVANPEFPKKVVGLISNLNDTTVAGQLVLKANVDDVNTALALKADVATTYRMVDVDTLLAPKLTAVMLQEI